LCDSASVVFVRNVSLPLDSLTRDPVDGDFISPQISYGLRLPGQQYAGDTDRFAAAGRRDRSSVPPNPKINYIKRFGRPAGDRSVDSANQPICPTNVPCRSIRAATSYGPTQDMSELHAGCRERPPRKAGAKAAPHLWFTNGGVQGGGWVVAGMVIISSWAYTSHNSKDAAWLMNPMLLDSSRSGNLVVVKRVRMWA